MKQWRRIVALLFCVATLLCLTACDTTEGNSETEPTEWEIVTSHPGYEEFDTDTCVLMSDNLNARLMVVDLTLEEPFKRENFVWEWFPRPELGWKLTNLIGTGFGGGRIRWSEYYQSYVVLARSASNWVGIIEYPSGKALWEAEVGYAPHDVEMLPNGDIVVAGSGGVTWDEGCLMYFTITEGENWKMTDQINLPSCHGALWDPARQVLWTIDYSSIQAFKIDYEAEGGPKFVKQKGMGTGLTTLSGHALTVDYSDPDYLWVSTLRAVYKFSKSENKLMRDKTYAEQMWKKPDVKSIVTFRDGTVAFSHLETTGDYYSGKSYVARPAAAEGDEPELVLLDISRYLRWGVAANFNPEYL